MVRRLAVLLAILLLSGFVWWRGWLDEFDVEHVNTLVRSAGAWGPALFVLLCAIGNGLGAPGFLFVLPAPVLWPPWEASLLIWLGAIGAGGVGYAFARGIGRRFVEAHLPRSLRKLDRHLGLRSVVALRAAFFLATPVHWALGLTSISPRALLIGSVIGFAPPAAFWGFAGGEFVDAMVEGRPGIWVALAALMLGFIALTAWLGRRAERGEAESA
ncbi:MAG TPA: VTT domain-containing protein [Myxococcota bacterium]|nr:VTT domain-containing protein [Myxococcota bacterium]